MFLIEHYSGRKATGDSSKQLARKILRYIQTTPLSPEQAEHDKTRRKIVPRPIGQQPITPVEQSVLVQVMIPTEIIFPDTDPTEPAVPTERPVSTDSPIELMAKIRELAGTQGFVTGLITKLHTLIGGDRVILEQAIDQLITDGKIECNDRTIVLEIYQRFTIK